MNAAEIEAFVVLLVALAVVVAVAVLIRREARPPADARRLAPVRESFRM